jgi:hypothetical protein
VDVDFAFRQNEGLPSAAYRRTWFLSCLERSAPAVFQDADAFRAADYQSPRPVFVEVH